MGKALRKMVSSPHSPESETIYREFFFGCSEKVCELDSETILKRKTMLWGYSPAQDLLAAIINSSSRGIEDGQTVNILLTGCSDPRHILKTVAKFYTHNVEVTLHFFVAEVLIDFVARELLLLTLAFEPSDHLSLHHKTRLWMEIFANALVRPKTMEYIFEKSIQLVHIVTDSDYSSFRLPCVDLKHLKYSERDKLENCFKYWTKNNFNVSFHWDARLRTKLGTRYDSRNGAFEWDYFMKIKDKPGVLITANEYNQWRKNGVAFVWLETEYCMSNPTFAMGVRQIGDQLLESGYYGDMEISPYYTFATDCEDEEMLKKNHHTNVKRGTDVFERNLMRCLFEIEEQKPYCHELQDERNLGEVVLRVNELNIDPKPRLEADIPKNKENYTAIPIKHNITFLDVNAVRNLPKKSQFVEFFDAAFVSQGMEKTLTETDHHKKFFAMMKNEGIVVFETRKAFIDLTEEGRKAFEETIRSMMRENQCVPIGNDDFENEFTVTYRVKRSNM